MANSITRPLDPSISFEKHLGTLTNWWRVMRQAGLTIEDLQLPIADPAARKRLAEYWKHKAPELADILTDKSPLAREFQARRQVAQDPFKGRPRVELLDVSHGWDSVAMTNIIIHRLKKHRLTLKDLLLCSTDWDRIGNLGVESDEDPDGSSKSIEGVTLAEVQAGENFGGAMSDYDEPTVIVFDRLKLQRNGSHYAPKRGVSIRDAVLIIFRVFSKDFRSRP